MKQISFAVDIETAVIFCAACCRRVKVHYIAEPRALMRYAHIECHGVHRIVGIPEMAVRVAELCSRNDKGEPIFAALWEELSDARGSDNLLGWAEDIQAEIRRLDDVPPDVEPDAVARHRRQLEALTHAIITVDISRSQREHVAITRGAPVRRRIVEMQGVVPENLAQRIASREMAARSRSDDVSDACAEILRQIDEVVADVASTPREPIKLRQVTREVERFESGPIIRCDLQDEP